MRKLIAILIVTIFFVSCQGQEKTGHDLTTKSGIIDAFSKEGMPSDWEIKLSEYNNFPFQWQGEKAVGLKLEIFKKETEKKDRSYKELYPKDDNTYYARTQIIRYLYRELDAGYSYKMMERIHPAQLDRVTKSWIIISPSTMTIEKDHNVPKDIYLIYGKVFKENQKSFIKKEIKDYFSLERPFQKAKFLNEVKAVIFEKRTNFSESFGIISVR